MSKSITEVTAELYELLEPLGTEDRRRTLAAAMALLGEDFNVQRGALGQCAPSEEPPHDDASNAGSNLGDNVSRWMIQNQVSREALDHVYLIRNGGAELIVSDVPGKSKREKTASCYLLVGIRNLLSNDEARFGDKEALEFCHMAEAYDKNNHTANRNSLGNRISGDRANGFSLTVPGLRDAAKLIKSMTEQE